MGSLDPLMNTNQEILSIVRKKSVKKPLFKVFLFCVFFLPITTSLGFWQLDRASEKANIQREQVENSAKQASEINRQSLKNFVRYTLQGKYLANSYLLDNRTRDGKVGYEVFTWLSLTSGDFVLVNRGWIKAGRYRSDLPEILTPNVPVELEAYFYRAANAAPVLRDDLGYLSEGWPKRIQSLDWDKLPLQDSDAFIPGQFRLVDGQQPGAYLADWPVVGMKPSKHTAYAVQWFALSVTLVLLSIAACWRIIKDAHVES